MGHATSLFAFGVPIVLYSAYLPESVQRDAETGVGVMIVLLALVLLNRWRRGRFHVAVHEHDGDRHSHGARTPLQAYAIGVVHGVGGTAGVGVLLLAAIPNHVLAVVCLAVFAFFTAVSMSLLSSALRPHAVASPRAPFLRDGSRRRSASSASSSASGTPSARSRSCLTCSDPLVIRRCRSKLHRTARGVRRSRSSESAGSGEPWFGWVVVDFDDDGILWIEPRPAEGGRAVLVLRRPDGVATRADSAGVRRAHARPRVRRRRRMAARRRVLLLELRRRPRLPRRRQRRSAPGDARTIRAERVALRGRPRHGGRLDGDLRPRVPPRRRRRERARLVSRGRIG